MAASTYYTELANISKILTAIRKIYDKLEPRLKRVAERYIRERYSPIRKRAVLRIKEAYPPAPVKKESSGFQKLVEMAVVANATLSLSLLADYRNRITNAVVSAVRNESPKGDLFDELAKAKRVSRRRAAQIAFGEMAKANNELPQQALAEAGIKKGVWLHSRADKKPRPTHLKMNGKEFVLSKGLYDSAEGKFVKPGELYGCTCNFLAIIPKEE